MNNSSTKNFVEISEKLPKDFDENLLSILRCPQSQSALIYNRQTQELISRQAKLAYKIIDGIPIMLVKKARKI